MRADIPSNPPRWQPSADPADIVVPGLNTTASVNDQIDQIEQLITIKLQNIDANFSKIQHLMSTKMLPAVKRYAVSTEPVREAAKFWTSFFEQAAQVRIPTYEEFSSLHEQHTQSDQEQASSSQSHTTPSVTHSYDANATTSESSFLPGQGAVSSTPATLSRHRSMHPHDSFSSQRSDEQPSWAASIESPLVRLDREIQNLAMDNQSSRALPPAINPSCSESVYSSLDVYDEEDTMQQRRIDKGKSKDSFSLRDNVLLHNLSSGTTRSDHHPRHPLNTPRHRVSPLKLKVKTKTPIPRHLNPYLPQNTKPSEWSGIVDLTDPSVSSPRHPYQKTSGREEPSSALSIPSVIQKLAVSGNEFNDSFDDSADFLPAYSPPVTMPFARAPRSSIGLGLLPKLGKTPKKEAAERIRQDLLGDVQGDRGRHGHNAGAFGGNQPGAESSMSTIPTPPSLSRYTKHANESGLDSSASINVDSSLESMMRRVGLHAPASTTSRTIFSSVDEGSADSRPARNAFEPPAHAEPVASDQQRYNMRHLRDEEISFEHDMHPDSDSDDSMDDEVHSTGHPSTAFLMASQRRRESDDSFGSSNHSSDSFNEEEQEGGAEPIHPFARAVAEDDGDGFDDSFDDDGFEGNEGEEETVFGVPPAQRRQGGSDAARAQQLNLLGEDLLQDTLGIGAHRVEESPTPFNMRR